MQKQLTVLPGVQATYCGYGVGRLASCCLDKQKLTSREIGRAVVGERIVQTRTSVQSYESLK